MKFVDHSLNHPISAERVFTQLQNGVRLNFLETGVLRVSPPSADKASEHSSSEDNTSFRIIISCGIHGNETAPIELVDQLIREIVDGDLSVNNELLFILGNPPAVIKETRFVEENLNRLFCGKHQDSSSLESDRARLLEAYVEEFFSNSNSRTEQCLHYDLHTSIRGSEFNKFSVYPFLHERQWSRAQLAFLERCGIEAVLLSNQPAATFSYFTSTRFAAHSFTLELGKVKSFGDNNMSDFDSAAKGLRRLIKGQQVFDDNLQNMKVFHVVEEVIKRSEQLKLHFPDNAKNFTEFPKNSLLVSDLNYEYRTKQDGERFVFPIINVPIGQRAMLVVAPTEF